MRLSPVIPAPKEAEYSDQTVALDSTWGVADRSQLDGLADSVASKFGIGREPRAKSFSLNRDPKLADEEYRLDISQSAVAISAASRRGFLHALATLTQLRDGPILPVAKVRDYPRLPTRGLQIMLESYHQIGLAEAVSLITSAAKLKLNTILLEFGDRFPFQRHAPVRSPSALTPAELRQILELCESLGLKVIPLLQSLGHLRYMLKHDEYADIREEVDRPDQMCPTNEKSFRMWTEMAEEVLPYFPGCTLMHIGADETRQLGVCPRCKAEAEKSGKASLYLNHINKVCGWLAERGITPMLWDDILCAHPGIMADLHKSAWIMYWDYWTTSSPSPLLVARYDKPRGTIYDKRWDTEWKHEASDATRSTLEFFGEAVSFDDLSQDFHRVYGRYLGDQLPKFVRAFPYIEYYQDHGRRVICGPTCAGNTSSWLSLPDFQRYGNNIKCFADRAMEAKTEGLITTSWYNLPPEVLYFGMVATAQFTW